MTLAVTVPVPAGVTVAVTGAAVPPGVCSGAATSGAGAGVTVAVTGAAVLMGGNGVDIGRGGVTVAATGVRTGATTGAGVRAGVRAGVALFGVALVLVAVAVRVPAERAVVPVFAVLEDCLTVESTGAAAAPNSSASNTYGLKQPPRHVGW